MATLPPGLTIKASIMLLSLGLIFVENAASDASGILSNFVLDSDYETLIVSEMKSDEQRYNISSPCAKY